LYDLRDLAEFEECNSEETGKTSGAKGCPGEGIARLIPVSKPRREVDCNDEIQVRIVAPSSGWLATNGRVSDGIEAFQDAESSKPGHSRDEETRATGSDPG